MQQVSMQKCRKVVKRVDEGSNVQNKIPYIFHRSTYWLAHNGSDHYRQRPGPPCSGLLHVSISSESEWVHSQLSSCMGTFGTHTKSLGCQPMWWVQADSCNEKKTHVDKDKFLQIYVHLIFPFLLNLLEPLFQGEWTRNTFISHSIHPCNLSCQLVTEVFIPSLKKKEKVNLYS